VPWDFDIDGYSKPIEIYKKWSRAINLIHAKKAKKVSE